MKLVDEARIKSLWKDLEKCSRPQRGDYKIQGRIQTMETQLILEAEIHEMQRIWRAMRGILPIFEKIIGEKLVLPQEDLSEFGMIEQEVLEEICNQK